MAKIGTEGNDGSKQVCCLKGGGVGGGGGGGGDKMRFHCRLFI